MLRRVHIPRLAPGEISLRQADAHHLRDVLRAEAGDEVELFDDAGATAVGKILRCDSQEVVVKLDDVTPPEATRELIVASAIPKGERADWMIEKLSELGVSRFIPLIAARSVVTASGKNKPERWRRIAKESARQSRRAGVMSIDEPRGLVKLLDMLSTSSKLDVRCSMFDVPEKRTSNIEHRTAKVEQESLYLSTDPEATPMIRAIDRNWTSLALFIGPEGGWTDDEIAVFAAQNLTAAKLTATILRVETAAVAAAAIAAVRLASEAARS